MLLKILEDKARKESAAEIRVLQAAKMELQKQAEKFEDIKEQKNTLTRFSFK
jgi:ACT domain-containing protein